jgi:hypothetical protein
MRKLVIGITGGVALLLAVALAWNAEATPMTGAATVPAQNYSPIEKVACPGWGPYCGPGTAPGLRPVSLLVRSLRLSAVPLLSFVAMRPPTEAASTDWVNH